MRRFAGAASAGYKAPIPLSQIVVLRRVQERFAELRLARRIDGTDMVS